MKIPQIKRSWTSLAGVAAALVGALLLSGCQSGSRPTMTNASGDRDLCPMCHEATHAAAVEDVEYTRCICPECGKVTTLAPGGAETLRHYLGVSPGTSVAVCDRCKSVVSVCAACQDEM